jgi:Polyketide cyclase / dehydrase and lipid transport
MRVVTVAETFPGSVHEAETAWYDTTRWPAWVDGLDRVSDVDPRWPQLGATVTWESGPAGRGRVVERVVDYEPLGGQTVEVQDDTIRGQQRVTFTPADEGVNVELSLQYEIKNRSFLTPLVDVLFIRRAWTTSLRTTLHGFGVELEAAREPGVG